MGKVEHYIEKKKYLCGMKLSKQLRSWYVTIHCVINIAIEMLLCISKIQSCDECQRMHCKMTAETPELHPAAVVTPWHHIGIDFIGPNSPVASDGSCYIFYSVWLFYKNGLML